MKVRKNKFRLPPLEMKVFQETYRLVGLGIPRLRIALSPVIPRLEPPQKQKRYPLWSVDPAETVSRKTYHNILSPPEISIEDKEGSWKPLSEPISLKGKDGYIVTHQIIRCDKEHRRNYCIFSRSSPGEEVTFHCLRNKTSEEVDIFIKALKNEYEKDCKKNSGEIFTHDIMDIRGFTGREVPAPHFKQSQDCIAVHAVKIKYAKERGDCNAYILVIIDRPTGYVKIRYYPNLSIKYLVNAIVKFRCKFVKSFKISRDKVHFVSEENGEKATALSLSKQELDDYLKVKGIDAGNVIIEPPIVFAREEPLKAHWLKKSSKLQERLVLFQNWYNLGRKKRPGDREGDNDMQEVGNKYENDNRPILLIEKEYCEKKDEIDHKFLKYSEIKRILRSH